MGSFLYPWRLKPSLPYSCWQPSCGWGDSSFPAQRRNSASLSNTTAVHTSPYVTWGSSSETHWFWEMFGSRLCHELWSYGRNIKCSLCSCSVAAQLVVSCSPWQKLPCKHRNQNFSKQERKKKKKEVSVYSNCVILTSPYHVVLLLFTVLHLSLVQNHLCYNSRNEKNFPCRCK